MKNQAQQPSIDHIERKPLADEQVTLLTTGRNRLFLQVRWAPMKRTLVNIAFMLASAAARSATPVECPPALKIASSVQPPAGWEVIPPRYESLLDNVTVYDGHPSQMASQVPDHLPTKGGFEIERWVVDDNTWLECRYTGTHNTIAKQIPKGFKVCKAYYKNQKFGLGPFTKFECE